MKILKSALVLAAITVTFVSCKKLNNIKNSLFQPIDVSVPDFSFIMPAVPIVLSTEASLGSYSMYFNLDSTVRANTGGKFGASAVSSIKVKQITINVTDADAANNLANFVSARFIFYSNTNSVEVASFTFPDTFSSSSTFVPVNPPELRDYFANNQLNYTVFAKTRRITSKPLTFVIKAVVSVK